MSTAKLKYYKILSGAIMEEKQVGKVNHYFPKIGVAVIDVTDGSIKVGDEIHIKGHTSDFRQKVSSMQIEQDKFQVSEPGQSI